MKQRSIIKVIIKRQNLVLLLKRSDTTGRQVSRGKYVLPGGRVQGGEQPEDAVRRIVFEAARLQVASMTLDDVITYVDEDRAIQFLVVMYTVRCAGEHSEVVTGGKYQSAKWVALDKIHQFAMADMTYILMRILQREYNTGVIDEINDDIITTEDGWTTIYSDGGSRGNPGFSAAGFVIIDSNNNIVEQGGEYLGITTNSQAEYHGVRLGLERALELGVKKVDFKVDNMMVVNQMNGIYRIKNRELWPIHERIRHLVSQFEYVRFSHVKREFNQLADAIVNSTLDEHARNQHSRV